MALGKRVVKTTTAKAKKETKPNVKVAGEYFANILKMFKAVRGGFEPPEQLPVRQFSKLLVSATHPPHL